MTTEKAIHLLRRLQDEQFDGINGDERREALEMAVRALEGDGDTISRQAAMVVFENSGLDDDSKDTVVRVLEQLPSAHHTYTDEEIQKMQDLESAEIEKAYQLGYEDGKVKPHWIPCSERLPECEQEVLICTKIKIVGRNAYIDSIITPAIYEDGTMRENDSSWRWEGVDWAGWDDEEDCGIIPEGWWENRHFNPDEAYNNAVDREVIAWMPLPEPYGGGSDETIRD